LFCVAVVVYWDNLLGSAELAAPYHAAQSNLLLHAQLLLLWQHDTLHRNMGVGLSIWIIGQMVFMVAGCVLGIWVSASRKVLSLHGVLSLHTCGY
jgi:hypothetical protein